MESQAEINNSKYLVMPDNSVDNKVKNARIMKKIINQHLTKKHTKKYQKYSTYLMDDRMYRG